MSRKYLAYIGIDISFGPKPVTFVALDPDQQPLAIGEGDVADALAYAAGQMAGALVVVNAATHSNRGRMKRAEVRKTLAQPPEKGKFTSLRQVEYELIQAGFDAHETAASEENSMPWVKRGYKLVEKLESLGYTPFMLTAEAPQMNETQESAPANRMWTEINADAAFRSLLGVVPLAAGTLEGRIQRQLVLRDEDLKVPDAMDFFEEVTRFKILKSSLPTKNIFSQAEINAWIGAHTAWLAANQPEHVRQFGEPEEGIATLPIRE